MKSLMLPRQSRLVRPKRALRATCLVALVAACACSSNPRHAATAPTPPVLAPAAEPRTQASTTSPQDAPPPPGLSPDWKFPGIVEQSLENGLSIRLVERHTLPLVELTLVVSSGSASDGAKPGLASVAGELLKAGGAGKWTSHSLLDAAAALGSSIDVVTDRDSTRIKMSVTRDHLAAAMDLIAAVAQKPLLVPAEFQKLKRREIDRVSSLARTSAGWVASMVLYRELFDLPSGVHPYATYDTTAKQLEALKLEDCRAWHKREVTPKNAFLVIAGDVDAKTATTESERAFGKWTGERPEGPAFTSPMPPKALSIYLVDRPASPQAEVYVATLGPERRSPEWPAIKTTNQILGGGVAGRLFLDVREKRSLAYRTRSSLDAVAAGPVPIVLSAGTQTAKAGLTLQALLEHYDAIAKAAPSSDETEIATRYLSDVFLVGVDTVGAIAGMTADLGVFGLPADYYDTYRATVRSIEKNTVFDVSQRYFHPGKAIVVVAGDAARLGKVLSHFGPVDVVDADAGFVTKTKLPHEPTAPIELPRDNGT
jgi:predicted Zn-dependent peptidase